jgi:hypothetical protein
LTNGKETLVYIDESLYLVESTKKTTVDGKIANVLWENRCYYTSALIYLNLYDEETDSISIYRTLRVINHLLSIKILKYIIINLFYL